MGKNKTDRGASMFSRSESLFDSDPMQEIFELNLNTFPMDYDLDIEKLVRFGKKNRK